MQLMHRRDRKKAGRLGQSALPEMVSRSDLCLGFFWPPPVCAQTCVAMHVLLKGSVAQEGAGSFASHAAGALHREPRCAHDEGGPGDAPATAPAIGPGVAWLAHSLCIPHRAAYARQPPQFIARLRYLGNAPLLLLREQGSGREWGATGPSTSGDRSRSRC